MLDADALQLMATARSRLDCSGSIVYIDTIVCLPLEIWRERTLLVTLTNRRRCLIPAICIPQNAHFVIVGESPSVRTRMGLDPRMVLSDSAPLNQLVTSLRFVVELDYCVNLSRFNQRPALPGAR